VDLQTALDVVRSGWARIVTGVVLGALLAGAWTATATPQYSSSTRLFVSAAGAADPSAAYQGDLLSQQRVMSYAAILTGEALAAEVVDELELPLSPADIAEKVQARALPETVLLEVTVTDSSAERARDIADALTEAFTDDVADLETPAGSEDPIVRVETVQPAQVDPEQVSPSVVRNVALGAFLGLLVGLAWALARLRLDRTVRTAQQVQALTGRGLLGSVPEDPQLELQHVVAGRGDADRSVAAERIRAIRTSLQYVSVDHPPKVVVVTSSVPGEGKTTVAVNLAAALAQTGRRVVFVEADLREPRAISYLGLISGVGLTNILAGTATLEDVVQHWGEDDLAVIAAGPTPAHPSELLGSARMRTLVEALRSDYDHVVIDSPPLLPVTDAAVLGVVADGYLLTARYGVTRQEQLAAAADTLAGVDATVLGVVLNRTPRPSKGQDGYGYGGAAREGDTSAAAAAPAGRAGLDFRAARR
jgi:succinoglycan biosynthesis transport protein ExoP